MKNWALSFAIGLIVAQISIFGVYRVPSDSLEPFLKTGNMVLVNRLAYGLRFPFLQGNRVHWNLPKASDIVVIETKAGRRLLKRVMGVPFDRFMLNGRRIIVPKDTIFVGVQNSEFNFKNTDFGFVSIKNILGRVAFSVK